MKQLLFILFVVVGFVAIVPSCKKETIINNYTDTLILPSTPAIVGTTTNNRDTTKVTVNGVTIYYYSTSPCAPSNEIFYFWVGAPSYPTNSVYNWQFGDGNIATGTSVSNKYNSGGIRTLTLEITVGGKTVSTITTSVKSWGQNVTPNPTVYAQQNDYTDFNYIAFNAQSGNVPAIRYEWDFADGTKENSPAGYHEHYFPLNPKEQTYYVQVSAVSSAGCKGTITDTVKIPAYYGLPCNFTTVNTNPCYPNTEMVKFYADSTGVPNGSKYYWDYGDGTQDTTYNFFKTHSYANNGIRQVILRIKLNGRQLCNKVIPVQVWGQGVTPRAIISQWTSQNVPINTTWFFNSGSNVDAGQSIDEYIWNFGDGTSDSTNNPSVNHTFPGSGVYKVQLTVGAIRRQSGCTDTTSRFITVP